MAVYKRTEIEQAMAAIKAGEVAPVYLLFGDRFLCQELAGRLVDALLPDDRQRQSNVTSIDGSQEDQLHTLNLLRSFHLFPGRRILRVVDSRLFLSKEVSDNLWDKARELFEAGQIRPAARRLASVFGLAGLSVTDWQAQGLAAAGDADWQRLFGFAKPDEVGWVEKLLAEAGDEVQTGLAAQTKGDAADRLVELLEAGVPAANLLLLLAEAVDKRKKLYKYLQKNGVIFDLSVEGATSSASRQEQSGVLRELIRQTLSQMGKKAAGGVVDALLDKVGFHPVAAVMETEKLALAVDEAAEITLADVQELVGRTREDALYELNETVSGRDLGPALGMVRRMLESGLHPLVVVAGLRGFFRKLLVARACIEQDMPPYQRGMSYGLFQKQYLPGLKAARGELPEQLKGHPFVVYKLFGQAEKLELAALEECLQALLDTEYGLKGGTALPPDLVLESCLFRINRQLAA